MYVFLQAEWTRDDVPVDFQALVACRSSHIYIYIYIYIYVLIHTHIHR